MSVKFISKGARQKRNENVPDILQCHSTVQNSIVFHNISKPSPVLSDTSEFPSLNETSEKTFIKSPGKILKYSDKLKSKPLSNNPNNLDTVSDDFNSKSNVIVTNSLNQHNDKIHTSKFLNRWNPTDGNSNFNKEVKNQNISQDNVIKPRFISTNKVAINPNQNISKKPLNPSTKEYNSLSKLLPHVHQKELLEQKHLDDNFKNPKIPNSVNVNLATNATNKTNKSVKLIEKKNELKEESIDGMQSNAKEKKKKKRKSKFKRQVALQSGKITVLTPEVHLKILSQTNATTTSNSKSVLTDINDEEEYPELGKPLLQTNQKGNHSKKNLFVEASMETTNKPSESCTEDKIPVTKDNKELQVCDTSEKPALEKKGKCDTKTTVHPKDPITISFYDILLNKIPKPNTIEAEKVIDVPDTVAVTKIRIKQDTSRRHNLLDSSSPIVKRGKEREKPKPKKPSQLKKIILLDRKIRKEQLLNLKTSDPVGNDAVGIELVNKLNTEDHEVDITENLPIENNSNELRKITDQTLLLASDSSDISSSQQEEIVDQTFVLTTTNEDNLVPEIKEFSHSKPHSSKENDLFPTQNEDVDSKEGSSPLNKICENKNENNSNVVPSLVTEIVCPLNVSQSPDSLLNSLMNNVKKSEVSDKERAAKILLHTRNFREYCNHLISKDIDDAVFSLLDDLARFQDRLHQKDPVKARMKRRMINGIKEVKKHMKLRKLKCIIIAVDIENVETQGGLNDILNDIKTSAADHHIPCVFALSRKVLGKVCHKPVPVSCVGVLNFEGSEVNFKKMVELQTQSKADYNEIFSKLFLKLTDQEASALLKAKIEAPETLRAIRTDILNDFFMKSKTGAIENETTDIKSNQMSDLIDIEA